MRTIQQTILATMLMVGMANAEPITVRLEPPCLDDASIMKVAAQRPRRVEGVRIALEETEHRTIVHCYGHGGFGFTTLFGSVEAALALLVETAPSREKSICVIGSGCMGLTMALELYRLGFTDITIVTKNRYENISWLAGGFFDPGVGIETKPQDIYKVHLGLATYEVLYAIEQGYHPYLSSDVVRRLPIYYPAYINVGVEILEAQQLMPPSELVTIDFGNGVVYPNYKRQQTYFIDITKLMKQLWQEVRRLNIPVVEREITDFDHVSASIICNCTGLGAKELAHDDALEPARGHIFMLKSSGNEKPRDYMLFAPFVREERREYVSYFPKPIFRTQDGDIACCGVIGGTFIPCAGMSDVQLELLDAQEFDKLMHRAQSYFYGE